MLRFGWHIGVRNASAIFFEGESVNANIIMFARVPRVAASLLAGCALAVSGVIIQAVLENPLAAPSIIGVNSGAGFFAVLAMALFPGKMSAVPAAAFIGAVVTVMAVYLIAVKNGASKITLVLAGVAVSNLLGAGIDTITTFFPDSLNGITDFKIGGVMGISLSKLYPAWIYIAVGIAAALLLSGELDILSLGDKTAKSLGLNVRGLKARASYGRGASCRCGGKFCRAYQFYRAYYSAYREAFY